LLDFLGQESIRGVLLFQQLKPKVKFTLLANEPCIECDFEGCPDLSQDR